MAGLFGDSIVRFCCGNAVAGFGRGSPVRSGRRAGPARMKVTGVQRGDGTTVFTLPTTESVARIGSISFHDARGKEIDTLAVPVDLTVGVGL